MTTLATLSQYDKDDEWEAWLRDNTAKAMRAQGKFGAAQKILEPILDLDPAQHKYIVNQLINTGEALYYQGRFSEAIALMQKAHGHNSAYGEMWVRSGLACANWQLGQTAKANAEVSEMSKAPEENYAAAIEALLCVGRADDAAGMMIKRIKERSGSVTAYQDCRVNDNEPKLAREQRAKLLGLRDRPEVRAVFDPIAVVITTPTACDEDPM